MENLVILAVIGCGGWWLFKAGKKEGSRKGFGAGRAPIDDNVTVMPTGVAAVVSEPADLLFGNEWDPEETDPWDEWIDHEARLALDGEEV